MSYEMNENPSDHDVWALGIYVNCFYTQFMAFSAEMAKSFCDDEILISKEKMYYFRRDLLITLVKRLDHDYEDIEEHHDK